MAEERDAALCWDRGPIARALGRKVLLATLVTVAIASGANAVAEERPQTPDYSKETLTLMFRDLDVEKEAPKTVPGFPLFEYKYQSKTNPLLSFVLRSFLLVAPLPGTVMKGGSLTPVIDPFEMTGMSLPFTPSTIRDRNFERKLRRQLNATAK